MEKSFETCGLSINSLPNELVDELEALRRKWNFGRLKVL
jgi:hypothetical protein